MVKNTPGGKFPPELKNSLHLLKQAPPDGKYMTFPASSQETPVDR